MIVWTNKLIPFGVYKTFNFYGIILFTKTKLGEKILNHEKIHSLQMAELAMITVPLTIILMWAFGISAWWLLAAVSAFYIWYGLEYLLIRLFRVKDKQNDCYHDVSLEEEAYNNDDNLDYISQRNMFAWIKYIRIKSYENVL